jgi:cell division protein FtsB
MWLAMFGGAGLAVFLSWAVPIVVFSASELQAKAMIAKLQKRRMKLVEEWGGQFVADMKDSSGNR